MEPERNTWVEVKADQVSLIMAETLPRLYDRQNCLASAGVYQATPGKEFSILIENFISKTLNITEGQTVTKAAEHPVAIMESTITDGGMPEVVDTKTVYRKHNKSTRDIDVIKKHIADAREAAISKADQIIDANNFKLGVD